jgi:hypothetical protein
MMISVSRESPAQYAAFGLSHLKVPSPALLGTWALAMAAEARVRAMMFFMVYIWCDRTKRELRVANE